jgi:hypothetical protein
VPDTERDVGPRTKRYWRPLNERHEHRPDTRAAGPAQLPRFAPRRPWAPGGLLQRALKQWKARGQAVEQAGGRSLLACPEGRSTDRNAGEAARGDRRRGNQSPTL